VGAGDRRRAPPPGYYLDDTFHPTFLYEFLWCLAAFASWSGLDRRFRLGYGRVAALYVMAYTLGAGGSRCCASTDVRAPDVGGLRFNVWTSIVLFVAAAIYFVISLRRHPGREESMYVRDDADDADDARRRRRGPLVRRGRKRHRLSCVRARSGLCSGR
jgi:prolipoprotein diacylglyceryltransferase